MRPLHLQRVAQLYAVSSESDWGEEKGDSDHHLRVLVVGLLAECQAKTG